MEMARIFAEDSDINVVGLVMIECIYPRAIQANMFNLQDIDAGGIKSQLREKVVAGIMETVKTLMAWELPEWTTSEPPPAALFRAESSVPSWSGEITPRLLGWDQYANSIFKAVYNIPGHHFNIFNSTNVSQPKKKEIRFPRLTMHRLVLLLVP